MVEKTHLLSFCFSSLPGAASCLLSFFFKKSVWSNCFNHANLKNRFWPSNLKTKKCYRVVLQSNLVIEKGFKGLYHSVFPNIVTAENVKWAIIPSHYKWVRTSVSILEKMVKWRSGKKPIAHSGEKLTNLSKFFPVIEQVIYFQRYKLFQKTSQQKKRVYPSGLVLVPKLYPGTQVDLSSNDPPEEIQKLVKKNSVHKIVFHFVYTENVSAKCMAPSIT